MKKLVTLLTILCLSISLFACKQEEKSDLPKPELDTGMRGELGIDKNINETTIDNYLNREDVVYRDMRMLKDSANYEAIGGDSYLSGFVKGFEVVPYPYLCNPRGLPEDVGIGYTGNALYTQTEDKYVANYEEALDIIESLFPRDKVIFLMCGGGGYAGMTKALLVYLGYDADKIYDVGGYWYYEGDNKVEVKSIQNNETTYNFDLVNYHDIDFESLHITNGYVPRNDISGDENKDVKSSKMVDLPTLDDYNKLIDDKQTFLVFTYLPGCVSCASFKPIVEEFIDANDVIVYSLNYQLVKDTGNEIETSIRYTPSIFIYKDGVLQDYLDMQSEDDKVIYTTTENFSTWINEYIDVNIIKTNTTNNLDECGDACKLK